MNEGKFQSELIEYPSVFGERNHVHYVVKRAEKNIGGDNFAKTLRVYGVQDNTRTTESLFINHVWEGSVVLSDFIINHPEIIFGKNILELGAGTSLPSLVSSLFSPELVISTDFPDEALIDHISKLVEENSCKSICVAPFKWGDSPHELLNISKQRKFDVILLAELLWKDTFHLMDKLLSSVKELIHSDGKAYFSFAKRLCVDFTEENIQEFFQLATEKYHFIVELIETNKNYKDAMENSVATVFIYTLQRKD